MTYTVTVSPGYTIGPGLEYGLGTERFNERALDYVGKQRDWIASSPYGSDTFAFLRARGFDVTDVGDDAVYQLGPNSFLVPFGKWRASGTLRNDVRWTSLDYRPAGVSPTPGAPAPPTPAPPVAGAPAPNLVQNFLTADDVNDYLSGYATAQGGDPRKPGTFWYDEGYEEAKRGLPQASLNVGAAAPGGVKYATITSSEYAEYQTAYAAKSAGPNAGYWGRQGALEAQVGVPQQPLVVGQPPPPFAAPLTPSPTPTTPASPRLIYTAFPCYEIAAKLGGKYVPYDTGVKLGRMAQGTGIIAMLLSYGVEFELLGPNPGDQRRGYRLSGPSGPIARRVVREIANGTFSPNPNTYRLPAWVAAYWRQGGLRMLGAAELADIGMLQAVLNAAP